MTDMAENLFHALGDLTRRRCLILLQREGELCVCELMHSLGESQPKISRHLAQLREMQIVIDRRQGQWVYYRVNPELPAWAREVLRASTRGLEGQEPFVTDRRTLEKMPDRPGAKCCQ